MYINRVVSLVGRLITLGISKVWPGTERMELKDERGSVGMDVTENLQHCLIGGEGRKGGN